MMMMASPDASVNCHDITEAREGHHFASQDINIQTNYHQQQYMNISSLCDKHDSNRFNNQLNQQQLQQQHQELYESHFQQQQEHNNNNNNNNNIDIQNSCNCYQNGGNQICSGCQTNEEQNNTGAFIYQTIQANDDDVILHSNTTNESQTIQQQQQLSTGGTDSTRSPTSSSSSSTSSSTLSSPSSSTSTSSATLTLINKHLDNSFIQAPIYENNIKYYLKPQQQQQSQSQITSDEQNNNTTSAAADGDCTGSGNLVSTRCRQSTNFSLMNNKCNDNSSIIENDIGLLYHQCSNNDDDDDEQIGARVPYTSNTFHDIIDDWNPTNSCANKLDNNNNNNQPLIIQETYQYSMIPAESNDRDHNKSSCQIEGYQFNNNNNNNNNNNSIRNNSFTSDQHYGNSPYTQQTSHHQCEPTSSISFGSTSFNSTNIVSSSDQVTTQQVVNYNHDQPPQLEQRHSDQLSSSSAETCSVFMSSNLLDSPAQLSYFRSSSGELSYQHQHQQQEQQQQQQLQFNMIDTDQSVATLTNKSKARRKNPTASSKVNGKLWEFIRDLLLSDRTNPAFIRWERREDGVFKFVQSNKVAKMWGERKQNPKMTYEKLSRAMRYYYKSKVLLPVFGRRLVYKFGPNASGWNKTG